MPETLLFCKTSREFTPATLGELRKNASTAAGLRTEDTTRLQHQLLGTKPLVPAQEVATVHFHRTRVRLWHLDILKIFCVKKGFSSHFLFLFELTSRHLAMKWISLVTIVVTLYLLSKDGWLQTIEGSRYQLWNPCIVLQKKLRLVDKQRYPFK